MSRESRVSSPETSSAELLDSISDLPRHEVERLLGKATGRSRTDLLFAVPVSDLDRETFIALVGRRRSGEPLQYLEERIPFGPIEVSVDRRVLVPRPETEQLFELATQALAEPSVVVDLCTGSGNLALALKHTFPDAVVYATDRSADATAVAEENAREAGLEIAVFTGDLFEPLPEHLHGQVDLIVANPPYLAEDEAGDLPVDVRDHEPRMALIAGPTGDEVLAAIAREAFAWLVPGGVILCEISEFRGAEALALFAELDGVVEKDLAGKDRFVVASV